MMETWFKNQQANGRRVTVRVRDNVTMGGFSIDGEVGCVYSDGVALAHRRELKFIPFHAVISVVVEGV